MFGEWLKDLWKEAWGRGLFLIGFGSNVITFLLPGLQAQVLRGIGIVLLFVGFLWANFNVYKKHRTTISRAEQEITKKDAALQDLGGQFKSGQLGSDQNRPTEVARNC
jgi:hypothetical protein